jgi:hypothetical protein
MAVPSFAWVRDLDGRAWRTATWSVPFIVQVVLGMLFLALWALGTWPFHTHGPQEGERDWMLTATLITTLMSLVFVAALLQSPAPRRRALALSLAGCCAVISIGATVFAYLVLR